MKLTSYDPVRVPMPDAAVTDQQVHERASQIVAQIPCFADVTDQPVGRDDKARVRITMREDGTAMKGLDGAEIVMSLGDGFFPAGLVDGVVGMMPGQTRHVECKSARVGAEDESARSAEFDADVEVLSVRKRVRPDMTDEWVARHVPRCSTLDEFFADVRAQIERESEGQRRAMLRQRCAEVLALRLDGAPSSDEVSRSIEGVRANFDRGAAREGKTRAEKAAELGLDDDQLEAAFAQEGAHVAMQGIAVRCMADHLGVTVDDADIERALSEGLGGDDQARRMLETGQGRAKLEEAARCEKALDWVVEHAVVVPEAPGDPESAAPAGPERPSPFAGASVA